MRLIRSVAALVLLNAGAWMLDRADGLRADLPGPTATRYRPVERMLIGSLIGVFIAGLWIWISARAGR
jgi:hypothetical protein